MIEFVLPLTMNDGYSLNKIYSGKHWSQRQAEAQMVHDAVKWAMIAGHVPKKLFDKPVNVIVYYNDKLDSDNHGYMLKMIVDGLKDYLIKDDNRKYVNMTANAFWDGKDILVHIEEAG